MHKMMATCEMVCEDCDRDHRRSATLDLEIEDIEPTCNLGVVPSLTLAMPRPA
jgi:hypothetical protein